MLISAKTDKGPVRQNNQDSYNYGNFGENTVWAVVCDGMGGSAGGNVASEETVQVISKSFEENLKQSSDILFAEKLTLRAVNSANAAVFEKASSENELHGMGTTMVSLIVIDNNALIAHVGDSRAYLISDGNIEQITTDHSIVQTMVESGQLTENEAKMHPNKNIITRAVGVSDDISPDIQNIIVKKNDIILLCTDGLTNSIDTDDILHSLTECEFCDTAPLLIDKAISNSGTDNITAVLIKIQ